MQPLYCVYLDFSTCSTKLATQCNRQLNKMFSSCAVQQFSPATLIPEFSAAADIFYLSYQPKPRLKLKLEFLCTLRPKMVSSSLEPDAYKWKKQEGDGQLLVMPGQRPGWDHRPCLTMGLALPHGVFPEHRGNATNSQHSLLCQRHKFSSSPQHGIFW